MGKTMTELSRDLKTVLAAKEKGERTFSLRSQDISSPEVIAFWIMKNILTAPAEKLHQALDDAIEMRSWPNRKHAD